MTHVPVKGLDLRRGADPVTQLQRDSNPGPAPWVWVAVVECTRTNWRVSSWRVPRHERRGMWKPRPCPLLPYLKGRSETLPRLGNEAGQGGGKGSLWGVSNVENGTGIDSDDQFDSSWSLRSHGCLTGLDQKIS